jgi:hypothetical protein
MKRFLLLIGVALSALPSATARAADVPGTYVVASCSLGDQPIPLTGWYRAQPSDRHLVNTCGKRFGYFAAERAGQTIWGVGERYQWLWNAPADTAIFGVRAWGETGSAAGRFGVIGGSLEAGNVRIDLPGGDGPVEKGDLNATQLALTMGCGGLEGCLYDNPPPAPGSGGRGVIAQISRLEILLRDLSPPEAVSGPTGTLIENRPLSGESNIRTSYRDRGGGLRSVAVLLDGVSAVRREIASDSCRQPSAVTVPCPTSGEISVDFDTRTVSDGQHRVELVLEDVGGNRTIAGSYLVNIRNAPPAATERPGRLRIKRYSMRVRYGSNAALRGALIGLDESPIAGAEIQVASRVMRRGAEYEVLRPVSTDATGGFVVPIPAGPSREFRLRYASSETSAEVIVPAPVSLKVSPRRTRNRKSVRFSGSIPGTDAGTRVELQARAGRRWVPFRTTMLARGKFSARYRFTSTRTTQRYSFRAVVRRDPNFPYAPATSRIVKVLVRP